MRVVPVSTKIESLRVSTSSINSLHTTVSWEELSQLFVQTSVSTVLAVNELLKGSRMRPLVEKADSEATVDIGIASTSSAILESTLYLLELTFH